MIAAVIPNETIEKALAATRRLLPALADAGITPLLPEDRRPCLPELPAEAFLPEERLYSRADLIIPVGGDGSVLRAAKRAAVAEKPVLGVSAGNLAYLSSVDGDDFPDFRRLISGDVNTETRMLLRTVVRREDDVLREDLAVNDVVLCRGPEIGLVSLRISADGKPIRPFNADGVIFATPTGSTAYSMSAGGPIVDPTLDAVLLTPVCPHSLALRPFIFPASTVFTVSGTGKSRGELCYSADGGDTLVLKRGDTVEIRRASLSVTFVNLTSDHFIDVLNKKIM